MVLGSDMKFFDGNVWKPISEYSEGDMVLQYNRYGTASLVNPIYFGKTDEEEMYRFLVVC